MLNTLMGGTPHIPDMDPDNPWANALRILTEIIIA